MTTSEPLRAYSYEYPLEKDEARGKTYLFKIISLISSNSRVGIDMRKVSSNTWCVDNIVERQRSDQRVHFHEER
jgi:hypothetical protein